MGICSSLYDCLRGDWKMVRVSVGTNKERAAQVEMKRSGEVVYVVYDSGCTVARGSWRATAS